MSAITTAIARLPLEKQGKALSYIAYLAQEPEEPLLLGDAEEEELYDLLHSGDFVHEDEVKAMMTSNARTGLDPGYGVPMFSGAGCSSSSFRFAITNI